MKPITTSAATKTSAPSRPTKTRMKWPSWEAVTAVSTAWSAVVSTLVLVVGYFALEYTGRQIEDFRKEAQAQHLIEKVEAFDSPRYKAIRNGLAAKRLNQAKESLKPLDVNDAPVEMVDELTFCNDLGILTRHGALSAYDVWGEFSFWLLPLHTDAQALIKADQKDAPASWSNCDYLVEEVKKVDAQEDAGKQLNLKEADIVGFYFSELDENGPRGRRGKP